MAQTGDGKSLVENLLKIINDELKGPYSSLLKGLDNALRFFQESYGFKTSYIDISSEGLIVVESICSQYRHTSNDKMRGFMGDLGLSPDDPSTYPFTISLGLICVPGNEKPNYSGEGPGIDQDTLYYITDFMDVGKTGDTNLFCARRVIVKPAKAIGQVSGSELIAKSAKACREFRESHSDLVNSFISYFGLDPAEVVEFDEGKVGVDLPLSLNISKSIRTLASRLKSAVSSEEPSLMLLGIQCPSGGEGDYIVNADEEGTLIVGERSGECLRYFIVK